MSVDPQKLMELEMSQQRDIQNLLWALKEMGVTYTPSTGEFHVSTGASHVIRFDPVDAAKCRQEYIRKVEVKTYQTFPTLADQIVHHIEKNMLPELKPSNVDKWKKGLIEQLNSYIFEVRKVNA